MIRRDPLGQTIDGDDCASVPQIGSMDEFIIPVVFDEHQAAGCSSFAGPYKFELLVGLGHRSFECSFDIDFVFQILLLEQLACRK